VTPGERASAGDYSLSEIVAALSHALDLTEGQPVGHSQRTCLIGLEIADRLGLDAEDRHALFYAILLKDAGCSSSAARICELFGADDRAVKRHLTAIDWTDKGALLRWIARDAAPGASGFARAGQMLRALRGIAAEARAMSDARCDRGARVVAMLGCPPAAVEAVQTLGEHWDGRGQPRGLRGEQIPILARIAGLAQTVEVFHASAGVAAAVDVARARRGRWFDPRVVDAFLSIGPDELLWRLLPEDALIGAISALEPPELAIGADEDALDRIAEAFAGVIDAKTPFTARHSFGVAYLAELIGRETGASPQEQRTLRRAGLLHDVGKLGVSNAILDKPDRLTDAEFAEVRRHPLHSERILSQVRAFADVAPIAAAHHERLDGRGYHRGRTADELTPAMRALAVADVYEALTADRPYRSALDPREAIAILRRDAGTAVCPVAVEALAGAVLTREESPQPALA
jgi:HD-GYP domain-containing protein (c-di-GMP phosphodiesterase class II)